MEVSAEKRGQMAQVIGSRMSVEMEGEFVVFLIGMRVNKPWKLHKWLPVFLAMPKMLKEREAHPESGCLGHSGLGGGNRPVLAVLRALGSVRAS